MSKDIHTPREELICGKLDALVEELRAIERGDLIFLVEDIRHDAQRMEAKLFERKREMDLIQRISGRLSE